MQSLRPRLTSLSHAPLSQLKGIEPALLYDHFKQQAEQASGRGLHCLRQVILGQKLMQQTNYMSLSLQVRHFHIDYSFQQPYQAVFLASCPVYHPWHISHLASTISLQGELSCPTCKTVCPNLAAILTDALFLSVWRRASHNSDTKLIFRRRRCEAEELSLLLQQTETKATMTMVEQEGEQWIVETQIWQFSKDERIEEVSIEELTQQMTLAKGRESQEYEKDLEARVVPLLLNLICLWSGVRIRNPLVHRQCRHESKLLLFSFEQVYLSIISDKNKKIHCLLEGCSHFFSRSNFQEVGLVLPSLQNSIYEENNENMFGMIFGGTYIQNWHLTLAQQRLQLGALGFMPQIKSKMNELLTTASLREGALRVARIQKKMQAEKGLAVLASQDKRKEQETYVRVELGPSTMCPVRCYKCIGLNAAEAFELSLRFSRGMSQCPLCGHQLKKKQFYDCFYLDLKLYQFIFLQGHARQLIYHPASSSYCHQLHHFTGDSLRKYLRQSGRVNNGPHQLSPSKLNLRSKGPSLAIIHQFCFQEGGDQRILDHVVFVPQNQPIDDSLSCRCGRILRANSLLYLPYLEQLIAAECNGLTKPSSPDLPPQTLISSLEHYREIEELSELPERDLTLYWRNKQGQIIKQPFLFVGCSHRLETAICDFADIREQARGGATFFTCRLKGCKKQYRSVSEMRRLNLPIFAMLQEQPNIKREVVRSGNYWISYHQGTKITITLRNDHLEKEYRQMRNQGREEDEAVRPDGGGGRERLGASCFKTAVLERCYPSQLKDTEVESHHLPDPLPLPVSSSQGNLLLFRYPVPMTQISQGY